MRINVITLFPDMFDALTREGVTGRAIKQGLLELSLWNPRDFTEDKHRTVDDRPYGGGPGMVMMIEPLRQAIDAARHGSRQTARVIYLSPQGQRFKQQTAERLLHDDQDLILVAGRYEGVDQRLIDSEVDEELSIGDYVLSGGELAAMVVIDTLTRLVPGALGHEDSAAQDSFTDGLLDCPHYTRPERLPEHLSAHRGYSAIPAPLLSGDHAAIKRWRDKQALGRTWLKRPDLLEKKTLNIEQQQLLDEFILEHNNTG
jgi:tRNA (guanine37-N1)-methyltransferase